MIEKLMDDYIKKNVGKPDKANHKCMNVCLICIDSYFEFPSISRSTNSRSVMSEKPQEIWEMMNQDMKKKSRGVNPVVNKNLILEEVIKKRNKDRNDVQKYLAEKSTVLKTYS